VPFDINNNYTGSLFGKDRQGFITPDAEATETLRPFFPVPYPAPYLPVKRQDQGHPVLGGVVLTSQALVGLDASGAFVPAGLTCGTQGRAGKFSVNNVVVTANVATFTTTVAHSFVVGDVIAVSVNAPNAAYSGTITVTSVTGTTFVGPLTATATAGTVITGTTTLVSTANGSPVGAYCIIQYTSFDTNFTYNALTGTQVTAGGQVAVLAVPSDAHAGDVYTHADGTTYTIQSGDITAAAACTLFPGGVVRPVGLTLRNAWQYIGGVIVTSTTGGMRYKMDGVIPTGFPILNFKYEMGIPIQTEMVIRLPWIGTSPSALTAFAAADAISGYNQGFGRTFVNYVGTPNPGDLIVAARPGSGVGNYTSYNAAVNTFGDITGKIIGVQNMYPIRDFANRVRTLYDPTRLKGPITDPNPTSIQMGGSQTSGIPTQLHLTTDGIFNLAYRQGKTLRPEYSTYVLAAIRTF